MKTLARALFTSGILLIISASALADDTEAKAAAQNALNEMKMYQEEAKKLDASSVFSEMEKLREAISLKQKLKKTLFFIDADTNKVAGYFMNLKERREANDPYGAYYYGLYNLRICGGFKAGNTNGELSESVNKCFLDSLESFKTASAGQVPEASFNIGRMYEKSWGVSASKLVSADWFIKAAKQFNDGKSREGALASVEAALNLVPDHPEALRFRMALIK